MECRAVVSSLSDYIDMWLSESEVREIESHLVACPKCQTVSFELNKIKSAARALPQHTPSAALWSRIVGEIEPEAPLSQQSLPENILLDRPLLNENPGLNWWMRLNSRRFTLTLPQLAGMSAIVAALVIMLTSSLIRSPQEGFDISHGAQALETALLPDEDRIRAELDSRVSAINLRKANWDPVVRAEFEKHLNKIDDSLRYSREMLQINPRDGVKRQMVLTLYNEKRQFLEDVERMNW
ncbi:MAG: zf-HC2 domain-containing protein [Blastocatellia bacterium]|nr:zf-HC2 domain-containing protein [Blastocatellia bacterium]